jgi:hypothetical protein
MIRRIAAHVPRTAWLALAGCVALAAAPARAQTVSVSDALQLNREKVETQRRFIVGGALPLTEEEARSFWPLFEEYQKDRAKVDARADRLVADYAAAYASLSDTQARAMLDELVGIEEERLRQKRTWIARMGKVLPPRKLARYFQLEGKLEAVVRADLAQQIPLVP